MNASAGPYAPVRWDLVPGHTVLALIDLQRDFLHPDGWYAQSGIDISQNKTKSVFDALKQGKLFQYVVTVCDETAAEKCPVFPGVTKRLHWSFADPSSLTGSEEEQLRRTREIRDQIEARVRRWIAEMDG